MIKKRWLILPSVILLPVVIFFLGDKPDTSKINGQIELLTTNQPIELAQQIKASEAEVKGLKEGNAAEVVWHNPAKKEKTPYSIVYLHGFSASSREGSPIHRKTAEYFGCNLYLSRLYRHGIKEENALLGFEAEKYLASAKKAINIGLQIGDKVIVMANSAGAMMALYLASANPELIEALILYAPLVDFYDKDVHFLSLPWGFQIGKMITGSEFVGFNPKKEQQKQYWTTRYRLEAVVNLVALNEAIMVQETFERITCPVFLGYYYKDETNQDNVVSVPAIKQMFQQLGTQDNLKQEIAFDDAKEHVITSDIISGNWERVMDSTHHFLAFKLGINPIDELEEDILQLVNN